MTSDSATSTAGSATTVTSAGTAASTAEIGCSDSSEASVTEPWVVTEYDGVHGDFGRSSSEIFSGSEVSRINYGEA